MWTAEIVWIVLVLRVECVRNVIAVIGLIRSEAAWLHARTALRHRQFVMDEADMRDRSVLGLRRTRKEGRVYQSGLRRREEK